MSSTTEHSRGQALAIFAISLTAVLLAGALAFDVGDVMLERRDEQNAADAAAMAGARYILTDEAQASLEATMIAKANGFTHDEGHKEVYVNIPPTEPGPWVLFDGAIEVKICNVRPSMFSALAGILDWPVCARAVAAQSDGEGANFAILALDPDADNAVKISGNGGTIEAHGNIQINSESQDALAVTGQGVIEVVSVDVEDACRLVGDWPGPKGKAAVNCQVVPDAPEITDPLAELGEPSKYTPVALPPDEVSDTGRSAPAGCVSTVASPQPCRFDGSYAGTVWRLHAGLYPAGIDLKAGTFFLEPGIFVLGGGGFTSNGGGTNLYTVAEGGALDLSEGPPTCEQWRTLDRAERGGVMLFNTQLEHDEYRDDAGVFGPIKLNGSDSNVCLMPYQDTSTIKPNYNNISIYQDRHFWTDGDDIWINGDDSESAYSLDIRGTIYAPEGNVKVNGNGGDVVLDQVIGLTFEAAGNGGTILALDDEYVYPFYAAGLVE